jgi:hypothetical protein
MPRNGYPARCRQHEHDDGYYIYDLDPRTLDEYPSPCDLEEEVGEKDEARNTLSMALKTWVKVNKQGKTDMGQKVRCCPLNPMYEVPLLYSHRFLAQEF